MLFLKKIFLSHCQYQNKKTLFTDPIFSEGFDQVDKSLCFDRNRKYTLGQNTLANILLAWPPYKSRPNPITEVTFICPSAELTTFQLKGDYPHFIVLK